MAKSLWTDFEYPTLGPNLLSPKTILYEPVKIPITVVEGQSPEGERIYIDLETKLQMASITRLLGATDKEGQQALREWKQRIGLEKADSITNKTADTGHWWHEFCEDYVVGKPVWKYVDDSQKLQKASSIAATLNEKIRRVIGTELRVGHLSLGPRPVGGRFDMLVELHDGRIAVVDFKTARFKPKDGNRLENYAIQATFYAKAVSQYIIPPVDTIVVFQLTPSCNLWQESNPDWWVEKLKKRIEMYADLKK